MNDIIDKIIKEFYELEATSFGLKVGSADQTKSTIIDASDYDNDFGETYNKDDFKKGIIEAIQKDGFYIEQCYQVYLNCSSTEENRKNLERFKPIEEQSIKAYCDAYDEHSKYWRLSVDVEDIEDNCGWQFLEFWHYGLTDKAKKLIKDYLNKEPISEYNAIRYVNDGIIYIGITMCQINGIYKIGFNWADVCIDLFDINDKLISSIYYKQINDIVYCEEFSTDKTITLAENGEIINKER